MITLIGISGSLRKGSYNSAVLRAAAALMPPDSKLRIESIAGIPLYDGDDEAANGIPPVVSRLPSRVARRRRGRPTRRNRRCGDAREHREVHGGIRGLCGRAHSAGRLRLAAFPRSLRGAVATKQPKALVPLSCAAAPLRRVAMTSTAQLSSGCAVN
jgi:hypothetical protein